MGRHFASLLQQETDLLNLILVGLPASDNVPKLVGHETRQKMTVKEIALPPISGQFGTRGGCHRLSLNRVENGGN
jgi:hypothetical protein